MKHRNGSFIPVSYFVNGPVEGLDIYQVWMAISTPVSEALTCYTLDSTRNRSLVPNHSISKVLDHLNFIIIILKLNISFTLPIGCLKK